MRWSETWRRNRAGVGERWDVAGRRGATGSKSEEQIRSTWAHHQGNEVKRGNKSEHQTGRKTGKYDEIYLGLGFIWTGDVECTKPQCMACSEVLANRWSPLIYITTWTQSMAMHIKSPLQFFLHQNSMSWSTAKSNCSYIHAWALKDVPLSWCVCPQPHPSSLLFKSDGLCLFLCRSCAIADGVFLYSSH